MEDHFSILTPENRHAASPRLAPDQETVVYFDNPLSTSYGYLIPGPQDMSRRLIKFNLNEAVGQSKTMFQRGILGRVYFTKKVPALIYLLFYQSLILNTNTSVFFRY